MLGSTFRHIRGFGKVAELRLWNRGILSWGDYLSNVGGQMGLLEETGGIEKSLDALRSGDADFFAGKLPKSEHYRIALTYPLETLFLDIETTGLSLFYDEITLVGWSKGDQYGVHIKGQPLGELQEAFRGAKVLVTFNGSLFDKKFVAKEFPSLSFPEAHVDLRFLGKSCGFSGGQKEVEEITGFTRPKSLKGMQGEAAPILWHEYCRGNNDALKKLIQYNHCDIEGMKWILDRCISVKARADNVPPAIRSNVRFTPMRSRVTFGDEPLAKGARSVSIRSFDGRTGPRCTYRELNHLERLDDRVFIGIDLVSSEDRESGFCLLKGPTAETARVKTDDEMIARIMESRAHLVSIDSPLSIPRGRTTYYDDDPKRDEFGITRECERILKKRGINSYPCLIQSMQNLTKRGMELAGKIRGKGIPVIESYPGAAQDILSIPRKQAGLEYLTLGLKEFGIRGPFLDAAVSHDELDAITSALVCHFFWTGKFEALGNLDEDYLIVPNLSVDTALWNRRVVIGFSGPIATGKTTAAKALARIDFANARFSQVLSALLKEEGVPESRETLQKIGLRVNQVKGQRWLCRKLVALLPQDSLRIAIDGLRHPDDVAFLTESYGPGFAHIYIESSVANLG